MGVYKRGNSWVASWTENRQRRFRTFTVEIHGTDARTRKAAEAFAAIRKQEEDLIRKGLARRADVSVARQAAMPVDGPDAAGEALGRGQKPSIIGTYREVLQRRGNSDRYIRQAIAEARKVLGGFAAIGDITREVAQARIDALAGDISARAYNCYVKSARAVTRWAARPEIAYLASDPLLGLELKRDLSDVNPPRALDDDEVVRLLGLDTPRHDLYAFRLLTGLRGTEAHRMEGSMVERREGGDLIHLPARIQKVQTFRGRVCNATLPLASSIVLPMRTGLLFPKRLQRKAWRRDLNAAGVDMDRGPVSLRATFNQLMMRAGVQKDERSWLMRHWEGMTDTCYSDFNDPILIERMHQAVRSVESHLETKKGQAVA